MDGRERRLPAPRGDARATREGNLRVGAAVAEIEGLYTAALRARHPARQERLLAQLSEAAARLAALTAITPPRTPPAAGSRRRRRRAMAARGARWIATRFTE